MLATLVLMLGLGAILLQKADHPPDPGTLVCGPRRRAGDFQHEVLVTSYDEIGELQRLFNQMVVSLHTPAAR
ncbi:MAG: hypothetical protein U0Z44_04200 [Kouleothrix sp.]